MGIDGGGTKTAYLLTDERGIRIAAHMDSGSSYLQHGPGPVVQSLRQGMDLCLHNAEATTTDIAGVCIGLPLYGENRSMDAEMEKRLRAVFDPVPLQICNDVEVGWAGSLAGQPGIHIVAGTGSIVYGRDESGASLRCGGWNEVFGDEGSCYWAALQTMRLFTKQADGRIPRGALYTLIRQHFKLEDDFTFVELIQRDYLPYRDRTAAFQLLLLEAANLGDSSAGLIYQWAAEELALQALTVYRGLSFQRRCAPVSYSGGIFKAGKWVLDPLRIQLESEGLTLEPPLLDPSAGACILCGMHFAPEHVQAITWGLMHR